MTVQCENSNLRRIAGGLNTGDIPISIQRQFNPSCLMRLDVETMHADLRIRLTRNRILIGVSPRILSIVQLFRSQSLVQLQGILLHVRFVVANPDNLLRIGREHHRRVRRELLLIYPIWNTIEHLVKLTVLRHLALRIVIEQFHQIDIIVSDKGNLVAVGRENRCLLGATITQRFQLVVPDIIDIIDSRKRTAINRFRLRLDQNPTAVRAHDVVVYPIHLSASGCCSIEENAHLLTRSERITDDLLAIVTDLGIGFAIGHGSNGFHRLL